MENLHLKSACNLAATHGIGFFSSQPKVTFSPPLPHTPSSDIIPHPPPDSQTPPPFLCPRRRESLKISKTPRLSKTKNHPPRNYDLFVPPTLVFVVYFVDLQTFEGFRYHVRSFFWTKPTYLEFSEPWFCMFYPMQTWLIYIYICLIWRQSWRWW